MGDPLLRAVTNPRIAESLGLTDEQKAKIKELSAGKKDNRETQKKVREATMKQLELMKAAQIDEADMILVFSCGVGVQTVAQMFESKKVCAGCDTYALPGFQGVTPLEYDCKQCGQCYLNITGGICPLTACSKGLINGQCGGCKDGKCEVDPNMECGWERIIRRLTQVGRLDVLKCPTQVRNYATDAE